MKHNKDSFRYRIAKVAAQAADHHLATCHIPANTDKNPIQRASICRMTVEAVVKAMAGEMKNWDLSQVRPRTEGVDIDEILNEKSLSGGDNKSSVKTSEGMGISDDLSDVLDGDADPLAEPKLESIDEMIDSM